MQVKELKQLLDDYPDDYRVGVIIDESEDELIYKDFIPLEEHDPGVSKEDKLLLLYIDNLEEVD